MPPLLHRRYHPGVPCDECIKLMRAYGEAVRLYKEAIARTRGAVARDALLASEVTGRLKQACFEENQRFLEHWKSQHAPPAA